MKILGITRTKLGLLALTTVVGCGNHDNAAVHQVAARVNGKDITLFQLKNEFTALSALGAASKATPTREMLDSLIDEQLLIEQSKERKLDRDPQVIQAGEKARRQIMVRALQDNLGASLPQPTPAEVRSFYEGNAALFAKRRIYTFHQYTVDRTAFNDALKAKLDQAKSHEAVVAVLKAEKVEFRDIVNVRTAEQLPMPALSSMVAMNRGDVVVINDSGETTIMQLADFVEQPASLEQATPIIREYLTNTKKGELVASLLKSMRTTAKIEYLGPFAKDASQVAQTTPASQSEKSSQPVTPIVEANTKAKNDALDNKSGSAAKVIEADKENYIRNGMQSGKI
ncbi:MAG: EpsD family peptidyl-prolyl cis-trans isomerase [Pseudomonadota bacterium]